MVACYMSNTPFCIQDFNYFFIFSVYKYVYTVYKSFLDVKKTTYAFIFEFHVHRSGACALRLCTPVDICVHEASKTNVHTPRLLYI